MADITMCAAQNCKLAQECYRKQAKASDYQSMADFSHGTDGADCEEYWPVKWEAKGKTK
jgi:hypothetical protein